MNELERIHEKTLKDILIRSSDRMLNLYLDTIQFEINRRNALKSITEEDEGEYYGSQHELV